VVRKVFFTVLDTDVSSNDLPLAIRVSAGTSAGVKMTEATGHLKTHVAHGGKDHVLATPTTSCIKQQRTQTQIVGYMGTGDDNNQCLIAAAIDSANCIQSMRPLAVHVECTFCAHYSSCSHYS